MRSMCQILEASSELLIGSIYKQDVAAAKVLKIADLGVYFIPDEETSIQTFKNFSTEVDHFLVQMKIRHARQSRGTPLLSTR
jgi:hypothetical protein